MRLECLLMKIQNRGVWRFIFIVLLIGLGLSSCGQKGQVYKDSVLGISVEVPWGWYIEKEERVHIVKISPNNVENADAYGVITILGVADYDNNLLEDVEMEIARVEQISSPHEVIISQEAEEFKADDYEAIRVKLIIRPQSGNSDQNESDLDQPMDLIIIRGHSQLIVLQVRKSQTDNHLNEQIDEIIDSITLID